MEGIFVGIFVLVLGLLVKCLIQNLHVSLVKNKYIFLCVILSTGFLVHLFFEFTGMNKWYLKNGYAALISK